MKYKITFNLISWITAWLLLAFLTFMQVKNIRIKEKVIKNVVLTDSPQKEKIPTDRADYIRLDMASLITQGWGNTQEDKSITGKPIRIGNKIFEIGIGTHAPSQILISINKKYRFFKATIGLNVPCKDGSIMYEVFGDSKCLYRSDVYMKGDIGEINIPVNNVSKLKLVVTSANDGITCDHANWGYARLVY